jgi:hypothetical protein
MLRPEKRTPAAPEMLGSTGAGGAERFDMPADDNQKDTTPAGFVQSFSVRWTAQHFGLPQRQAAPEAAPGDLGPAASPAGGAG